MSKKKQQRFGELPPQYHFALNPFPSARFTRCLECENKTGQRKLPLLIHVDPLHLIALNYTNRFCGRCDLLIGHQHEIEHHLTEVFRDKPNVIGNNYLIIGTIEKKAWRENMADPKPFDEMRKSVHDFKSFEIIHMTMGGWFPQGVEPPEAEPPPSTEWIKQ